MHISNSSNNIAMIYSATAKYPQKVKTEENVAAKDALGVQSSQAARNSFQREVDVNWQPVFDRISSDPAFADQYVASYVSHPDLHWVHLDLGKQIAPGVYKMGDADIQYHASGQYQKDKDYFSSTSISVQQQRLAIYKDMKAKGSTGVEIFHALMDFNRSLPERYRAMAGLAHIPGTVDQKA